MILKHNENNLKTADLALATTLSLYFTIETTENVDNNKVIFVFKKSQDIEDLIADYWKGILKVEPQQFFNQLKVIKTRIYSAI